MAGTRSTKLAAAEIPAEPGRGSLAARARSGVLLDEKIALTVHLALGRSYPETGGVNESSVHWDMVCDLRPGGRLSADGEVIVDQDGFKVA